MNNILLIKSIFKVIWITVVGFLDLSSNKSECIRRLIGFEFTEANITVY